MATNYNDTNPVIGIPDRSRIDLIPDVEHGVGRPEDRWEMVVQDHKANRAGRHFDLRLGDPATGYGHSWALRKWPKPGEKALAIRQPTHTLGYFDFKGRIKEGYGAGTVDISQRGNAEIIEASDKKVKFGLYKGSGPEEYNLIHTGKDWLLLNTTPTRERKPEIPSSKLKMKDVKLNKVIYDDPTEVMLSKIDGAHSIFMLEPGRAIRTFSYRTSKKNAGGLIEHSQKLPILYNRKSPKTLKKTVLRGEVWAKDKTTGKPLPAPIIGGMLNSSVWHSRDLQDKLGPLVASPFDLVYFDGKNVEDAPFQDKLIMLRKVSQEFPEFELPDTAETPGQKRELLDKIQRGKNKQTKEGVILRDLRGNAPPKRVKFKQSTDVIIVGFFPGTGKYKDKAVGGFYYAYEDDPKKRIGKVGTGFTDALREDMYKNPGKYIGKVAKVEGQDIYSKDGVIRAIQKPSFKEFHIEKDYTEDT